MPNTAKTPTNDSLSSTAYSTNNYNNSGNNNDMDLAFDDVAEELKLLEYVFQYPNRLCFTS